MRTYIPEAARGSAENATGSVVLRFDVLGPLDVRERDDRIPVPRGPKVRQLLALLVVRCGTIVSHNTIIDELWGKAPPKTAVATVRTHVYHLRRLLKDGPTGPRADPIDTTATGYLLRSLPEAVDAESFKDLARRGERQLHAGDLAGGSQTLAGGLELWRGDPLEDVDCGPVLTQYTQHLQEMRIRILQQRISADMRLGRHLAITPELRSLALRHPLNEWLHGQLITALFRSGRRGEALRAYRTMREILREELGMDPAPALQELLRTMLSDNVAELPHDVLPTAADTDSAFGDFTLRRAS